MNERVKELAWQSIFEYPASQSWVFNDAELTAFVEDIINESINVMTQHDYHGEWLGEKIKEHFGIPFESKMKNKIDYSTNFMGPINHEWITTNGSDWAAGRIDIGGTDDPYGSELRLPPMKGDDWSRFSEWLWTFQTDEVWTLEQIVEEYEKTNPKIRWFKNERKD